MITLLPLDYLIIVSSIITPILLFFFFYVPAILDKGFSKAAEMIGNILSGKDPSGRFKSMSDLGVDARREKELEGSMTLDVLEQQFPVLKTLMDNKATARHTKKFIEKYPFMAIPALNIIQTKLKEAGIEGDLGSLAAKYFAGELDISKIIGGAGLGAGAKSASTSSSSGELTSS